MKHNAGERKLLNQGSLDDESVDFYCEPKRTLIAEDEMALLSLAAILTEARQSNPGSEAVADTLDLSDFQED